jgi:hypothetical protein
VVEVAKKPPLEGLSRIHVPCQLIRPWSEHAGTATTADGTNTNTGISDGADAGNASRATGTGTGGGGGGSSGMLIIGEIVEVAKRTWSNMNKLGGTGGT